MTEYIIREDYEPNCFSYYHISKRIGFKMINVALSNNDLSEYISDAITHEHIHKILDELFNNTVSKLFDSIEHYFRNHALHEKEITNRNQTNEHINQYETYQTFIQKKGFKEFLHYYNITQVDIIYASKICNDRLYLLNLKEIEKKQENKNISYLLKLKLDNEGHGV